MDLRTGREGDMQDLKLEVVVVPVSEAARADRRGRGADVSGVFHFAPERKGPAPGPDAEKRHGAYEPTAPKHHWSGWYAAYTVAREQGRTPEEAAKQAALHIEAPR
jgi:hypothetical protein